MRLGRLGIPGGETPVLVEDARILDLRPVTSDIDGEFFARGGLELVRLAQAEGSLPELDHDEQERRIGPPIGRPGAIICIGMNYAAHAAESGAAPPQVPIMFFKPPNTLVGPNDAVCIPKASVKTDWEVELGVVVSRRASYLETPDEAMDHIAGFVTCNDVSERDFQLTVSGGQWSKGKSAPGFSPTGPWLVTPDEVTHSDLRLRSWVNGQPRQDSTTADMIFGVEYVVWYLSQYMALDPGDLIMTGTPQGVALSGRFPYLRPDDVVELEIDGLGRQRQQMRPHTEAGEHEE